MEDPLSSGWLGAFRLRRTPGELHTEAWRPGAGWVEDARAADVYRNGQDYELLTEAEADATVAELE
jgi:hypothetical protein